MSLETYWPPMCLITYVVLRVKPGLTSCEDLTTALDNIYCVQYLAPVMLVMFYHINMPGILYLCFYRSHAYSYSSIAMFIEIVI